VCLQQEAGTPKTSNTRRYTHAHAYAYSCPSLLLCGSHGMYPAAAPFSSLPFLMRHPPAPPCSFLLAQSHLLRGGDPRAHPTTNEAHTCRCRCLPFILPLGPEPLPVCSGLLPPCAPPAHCSCGLAPELPIEVPPPFSASYLLLSPGPFCYQFIPPRPSSFCACRICAHAAHLHRPTNE
jgi:hypothetical protein